MCVCASSGLAVLDLPQGSQGPQNRFWELFLQEIQTLRSQTSGSREAADTEREETQQKVQVCVVAVWWAGVTTRGSQFLVRDRHDLPFPRALGSRGPS